MILVPSDGGETDGGGDEVWDFPGVAFLAGRKPPSEPAIGGRAILVKLQN